MPGSLPQACHFVFVGKDFFDVRCEFIKVERLLLNEILMLVKSWYLICCPLYHTFDHINVETSLRFHESISRLIDAETTHTGKITGRE